MADDPSLTPFAGPDRAANPQGSNILSEWSQALQDPTARAALLSFGLQMLQPPQPGQNGLGVLGSAVGAAGETVTRREKMEQEERESEAKLANSAATLGLAARRTAASEQNADTRRKALEQRSQPGAISAKDMMRTQIQDRRALEARAKWEAEQIAKELQRNDLMNTPNPTLDRYKGKSTGDIYRDLLADPEWRKRSTLAGGAATEATIPPAPERKVGQVYQTPKGPMEWAGNGWRPAKQYAPTAIGADDDEDE